MELIKVEREDGSIELWSIFNIDNLNLGSEVLVKLELLLY